MYNNIDFDYTIIMVNLIGEKNMMYESIKDTYKKTQDEQLNNVYLMEIYNKGLINGSLEKPVVTLMLLLLQIRGIFENGTIYICCSPEQSEEIRELLKLNGEKLYLFELKVIVKNNVIKLK